MPIIKANTIEWTQVSEKLRVQYLLKQYPVEKGLMDVGFANWPKGEAGKVHIHEWQDEVYIIVRGEGRVMFNDEEYIVGPGDMMHAKSGEPHATVEGLSEGGVDLFFALFPIREKPE